MGLLNEHIDFARKLRRNQTEAETLFWAEVRNRRFHNYKFRRQVPIDNYFADFLCEAEKLIVELDDVSHADRIAYDMKRTAKLNKVGYRVIRFTNADVYEDLDGVMEHLYSVLKGEL